MKWVRVLRSEVVQYELKAGDFLITEGGDFDKLGRGAVWNGALAPCLHQNHVFRIRADPARLVPQYLAIYSGSSAGRSYFLSASKRTTNLASINLTQVKAFPIPLPSLVEQCRIAEILDSVDESIRSTEQIIAKLQTLRRAMLADIYDRESWSAVPLVQVARISSGATPSRSVTSFWRDGTVAWVKTGEICFSAITNTDERVTASAVIASRLQIYPPGTILMAMYGQGATRGRVGILAIPAAINQACAALQCDPEIMRQEFLYHQLAHSYDDLRRLGHGSQQTNLNAELLGHVKIKAPGLKLQDLAVRRIQKVDHRIDAEVAALRKTRSLRKGLMEDLLTGRVRVTSKEEAAT
jgi:type I restriction enzyme S subunit